MTSVSVRFRTAVVLAPHLPSEDRCDYIYGDDEIKLLQGRRCCFPAEYVVENLQACTVHLARLISQAEADK